MAATALNDLETRKFDKSDIVDQFNIYVPGSHEKVPTHYALWSLFKEMLNNEEITAGALCNLESMKAIISAIAPSYSAGTRTFAVGDFCMYESQLYRCITSVSTPEPFNSAKWRKIDATSELMSEIHPAIQSSQPQGGFLPNTFYDLGEITGTVTFALALPTDNTIPNAYHWTFDTGSTAPTITWPAGIIWPDGFTPSVDASKHYEVLVRNGYASMLSYSLS